MPTQLGGAPPCMVCQKRVYYNEQKLFMSRAWHSNCFKCGTCNKRLENGTATLQENSVYCATCYRKNFEAEAAPKPKVEEYINREDLDCCPRCGKRVYFAETLNALGRKWHKACFSCAACGKKVEMVNACDHDGDLYCRACYGRRFGPKGYGFAGGSGMGLSMDTGKSYEITTDNIPKTAEAYLAPVADKLANLQLEGMGHAEDAPASWTRPKWGGGDYCPRCDKQVFIAEKMAAAGHAYHATCFSCMHCNKKLEAGKMSERDGEIFCNNCYGRQFGPKGYGFGSGAGALQTP